MSKLLCGIRDVSFICKLIGFSLISSLKTYVNVIGIVIIRLVFRIKGNVIKKKVSSFSCRKKL